MKNVVAIVQGCVIVFGAVLVQAQPPSGSATGNAPAQIFTPGALESLVGGIAFYSDPVIELVLDAAQNPAAIEAAAHNPAGSFQQSVLQLQQQYPALLAQLDQQLSATAQLGIAARSQLSEVWAAIDRVRVKGAARATYPATYEPATPASAPVATSAPVTSSAPVAVAVPAAGAPYPAAAPATSAFVAGALAGQAMQQSSGAYYRPGAVGGIYAPTVNSGIVNNGAVGAAAIHATNTTQVNSGPAHSNAAAAAAINNNANTSGAESRAAAAHRAAGNHQQSAAGATTFSRSAAARTSGNHGGAQENRAASGAATHEDNPHDATSGRGEAANRGQSPARGQSPNRGQAQTRGEGTNRGQSPARGQSSAGHGPSPGGRGGRGR